MGGGEGVMKLGKLTKLDLRDHWRHEALHFTQWLASSENLEQLGDEVGIDIKLIQTEAGVGKFSADILAEEEATGRKIIIENQLEPTDHSHLGQILTYAAGVEAEYLIWVVRDARDEHVQAVEWINDHTNEKVNFFLVRVELWRIGDSDPAPKFMVLVRPNNWTKSVRSGSASTEGRALSKTRLTQLEFWTQLRAYAMSVSPSLKLRTPRAQHWYDVAIGRSDCHVVLTVMFSENKVGAELYISDSKELYREFHLRKPQVEAALGLGEMVWQELPEKKASRIRVYRDVDFSMDWKEVAHPWLVDATRKLKAVFSKSWE
jgi:Domain of unknown function (DUF4268)